MRRVVVLAVLALAVAQPGCGYINNGIAKIKCPSCAGSGQCVNCGGSKRVLFVLPCTRCQESGLCAVCSGVGYTLQQQ